MHERLIEMPLVKFVSQKYRRLFPAKDSGEKIARSYLTKELVGTANVAFLFFCIREVDPLIQQLPDWEKVAVPALLYFLSVGVTLLVEKAALERYQVCIDPFTTAEYHHQGCKRAGLATLKGLRDGYVVDLVKNPAIWAMTGALVKQGLQSLQLDTGTVVDALIPDNPTASLAALAVDGMAFTLVGNGLMVAQEKAKRQLIRRLPNGQNTGNGAEVGDAAGEIGGSTQGELRGIQSNIPTGTA